MIFSPTHAYPTLLFDQNISHRVVGLIEDAFTQAKQVRELGLEGKSDIEIWQYASNNHCVVVTFDADFYDLSQFRGCPPKVIWLRFGNTTTRKIADILIKHKTTIEEFLVDDDAECLQILNH